MEGRKIRDVILGGQDGLVNVLGLILGVAAATENTRIVIIAGLAATFAESISMAAVAYTSSKAAHEYYLSQLEKERKEIDEKPEEGVREIREIYRNKGFTGTLLDRVVSTITSRRKVWLETMMAEEVKLHGKEYEKPASTAMLVGFSAVLGSLVPLTPFFFMPVAQGIAVSLGFSVTALFLVGSVKARLTIGGWWKSGLEMMLIGIASALAGYAIGMVLGRL